MASGRLQGFVRRTDRSASPFNNDRTSAQFLKFPTRSAAAASTAQEYATATQQHSEHQALALDSSVGSDFDHTKSDIPVHEVFEDVQHNLRLENDRLRGRQNWEQNQEISLYNPHRNVLGPKVIPEQNVSRNEMQYPTAGRYAVPQENVAIRGAMAGRFQALENVNLEIRGEGPSGVPYYQEDYVSEEPLPSEHDDPDRNQLEEVDDDFHSEITTRNSTPSRPRNPRTARIEQPAQADSNSIIPETDYSDEMLKNMKYSDLEAQHWEDAPNRKAFSYPRELRGTRITLESKIDYYLVAANKEKAPTGPGRKAAEEFFGQLSSKEWDQAGEIFMEKFNGLMQKLQAKRREKRHITEQFEREVQARERVVRGHLEKLDKKLNDMRTNGESLLDG